MLLGFSARPWTSLRSVGLPTMITTPSSVSSASTASACISTQFDALGGTWKAGIGYMDGEANVNSTYAAVPPSKPSPTSRPTRLPSATNTLLSKRTTLYTGMGYVQREVEFTETNSTSTKYEGKAYDFVMVSSIASNQPLRGSGRMS